MNRNRPAWGLAVLSLLVASCGSDGVASLPLTTLATLDPSASSSASTSTVGPLDLPTGSAAGEPSTSTGPAIVTEPPTTPVTEAPTTAPTGPCTAERAIPGEALEFSELTADLDGDGIPDRLTTFGLPTADGLMRWRARLELGNGPVSEVEIDDGFAPVQLLGTVQVDANPAVGIGAASEVLVTAGATDAGVIIQVLGTDEQRCLARFGDGLGVPATFLVGTGDGTAHGLRCHSTDGAEYLVQLRAESTDGVAFTTYDTTMQRVGSNLVPLSIVEGTATLDGPSLAFYGELDCAGIAVPAPGSP